MFQPVILQPWARRVRASGQYLLTVSLLAIAASSWGSATLAQTFDCDQLGELATYDERCLAAEDASVDPTVQGDPEGALPPAEEVGRLLSVYMCQQLLETGSVEGEGIHYERFGGALMERYGVATTERIGAKMQGIESAQGKSDPYVLAMFRGVFQSIINDDTCFSAFIASF